MSLRKLRSAVSTVRRVARRPGELAIEKYRSSSHFRRVAHLVAASNALAGTAAAQIDAADGLVCGTGLGVVFGLGLGILMLYLFGDAAYQGTLAWKGIKAPSEDQKRAGRERLGAAATSFVGGFFPGVFGVVLDRLGIGAFSCVDWSALLGLSDSATTAIVLAATSLPF